MSHPEFSLNLDFDQPALPERAFTLKKNDGGDSAASSVKTKNTFRSNRHNIMAKRECTYAY
jgi:hypothetical protein